MPHILLLVTHTHTHSRSQVIALIALSLVAGFHVEPEAECTKDINGFTVKYSTSYSFKRYHREREDNGSVVVQSKDISFHDAGISQGAQFFVAWGSFTLFYCVIAVLVYMFVTGIKQLEKFFDYMVWAVSTTKSMSTCAVWFTTWKAP